MKIIEESDKQENIFAFLHLNWKFIAIFTTACLLVAIFLNHTMVPKYRVEVVLSPVDEAENKAQLGQFSGLASIAGIDLGASNSEATKFERFLYMLKTPLIAEKLSQKPLVMQNIFAGKWNKNSNDWNNPSGIKKMLRYSIETVIGITEWQSPNYKDLSLFLNKKLEISNVGETSLIRISLEHHNPEFGISFIKSLRIITDNILREQDLKRIFEEHKYIEKRLSEEHSATQIKALANLYQMNEHKLMLNHTTLPVAYRVIQQEVSSAKQVSPQPVFNIFLALFLGMLFSTSIIFLRRSW